MNLNDEILESLQTIGGIFAKKGIPSIPVNLDYLESELSVNEENETVKELILMLAELFQEYRKKEKKVHKYEKYVEIFKEILEDNSLENRIIGRRKRVS